MIRTAPLICFLFFSIFSTAPKAQEKLNIHFGKVTPADFVLSSPVIDSNTNAVVIADIGTSEFLANTSDFTFSLLFTRKKRIKIINKKGMDAATITIPLYMGSGGDEEKLEGLKAHTYNLENGNVTEMNLEKSDIFTEKHSKNWLYKKFTFPAVKDGSILEYSYQIRSNFIFNLQPWTFQGEYPVLWSSYETKIPEFFKYVILSQGYQRFLIDTSTQSMTNFTFTEHLERETRGYTVVAGGGLQTVNLPGTITFHSWVMKNVPGLKPEPFTTTLRNSVAKIEFQLNQVQFPNQVPKYYMDSWEKVSEELMKNEKFGDPIDRGNNWLDEDEKNLVQNAPTELEKARSIYQYIRDNITCNDKEGILTSSNIRDVLRNKTGSVADINMLLIAMLRRAGLESYPVILSTRSNGFTHELYPLMDRFNYVIAEVNINGSPFYLDATTPHLAFGKLPEEVYNGHARLISKDNALPVFFSADSLKENLNSLVFISNMEKGGVEGTYTKQLGFYESLALRNKLSKTTKIEYEKTIRESYTDDISIHDIVLDSLKMVDEPVSVSYGLKLKTFDEGDIVYFNPLLGETIKSNPFVAAERFYPVEMPYTTNNTYSLNMEIPKGYKIDELPKSVRVNFNENEGMFEYIISANGDMIQLLCRLILKKANFLNEDYQSLREFFAFVIKKESEQIVFKRIK